MVAATDEEVIMTTGASDPESAKKMRIAKMAVIPTNDIIKGKVTDQKGETAYRRQRNVQKERISEPLQM